MFLHVISSYVPHHQNVLIPFLSGIGVDEKNRVICISPKSNISNCMFKNRVALALYLISRCRENDILVFHGQFNPYIWILIYLRILPKKHLRWFIWGGDLYQRERLDLLGRVYNFIIKRAINRINFAYGFRADLDHLKNTSKAKNIITKKLYFPMPVDLKFVQKITDKRNTEDDSKKKLKLLLGNSADLNNNFEDMIINLKTWKKPGNGLQIFLPFWYGSITKRHYDILRLAKDYFGEENVVVMRSFMERQEFIEFLSDISLVVYNHNRQQGVGLLVYALLVGTPIAVKDYVTTYKEFKMNNIEILNTNDLNRQEVMLKAMSSVNREKNAKNALLFTEYGVKDSWVREFVV